MLLIIATGISVAFLFVLVALYMIFRADKWDRFFIRQLEFSSPPGKPFPDRRPHDSGSAAASGAKASNLNLPFEISDNGGRRSGIERRRFDASSSIPKSRTGPDRRRGFERRNGLDRRSGITFRQAGKERRGAFR
ncbi:MAG: hypothetical protein R6V46_05410 [Desulfatiglandaceae bacterium]